MFGGQNRHQRKALSLHQNPATPLSPSMKKKGLKNKENGVWYQNVFFMN
jgi:hypothetical protein